MRIPLVLGCVTALLAAAPLAAQRCTALQPVRLAQSVAAAKDFPRPMSPAQVQELAQLLPVMKANPQRGVPQLRAWVAKGGYTAADRCPLVYALIRAVQTQTVPQGTGAPNSVGIGSGSAPGQAPVTGGATQAQIAELTAQVAGLQADLQQLQATLAQEQQNLRDLLANKPQTPGANATAEQKEAMARMQDDWQQKVDAAQAKIANLQESIAAKQKELAAKQAELQKLQGGVATAVDQAVSSAIP